MRLLVIFGPPAVGKMTVGRAVSERSSYRLFHNHHVIEPLLEVFDHGTPPFPRLLSEFRVRVIEEAAAYGTDLLLTVVWGLDLEEDAREIANYIAPYEGVGGAIAFVELVAPLATRLDRNRTEQRLAEKRSKRNVEWSDGNVREMERFQFDTATAPSPADALLAREALINGVLSEDVPAGMSWTVTGRRRYRVIPARTVMGQIAKPVRRSRDSIDQRFPRHRHLRIDNSALAPGEVADAILAWLG